MYSMTGNFDGKSIKLLNTFLKNRNGFVSMYKPEIMKFSLLKISSKILVRFYVLIRDHKILLKIISCEAA